MILSAAIDLGTTFIKGGLLDHTGRLIGIVSTRAPEGNGSGLIRECPAEEYLKAAEEVMTRLYQHISAKIPLGITSQRSTFTLWNKETGDTLTPLITWQDRRAADWCERNKDLEKIIIRNTGLLLTPHYVGPKISSMLESDPYLRSEIAEGRVLFGTLETWLLWKWTGGRVHRTDLTMAARTLMVDMETGEWSDEKLHLFGVRRALLPDITATAGVDILLDNGIKVCVTVADQSSAALAALGQAGHSFLVSLGTGGFVIRSTGNTRVYVPRYLTSPLLKAATGETLYMLEGTINGIGGSATRFGNSSIGLRSDDPYPEAFCFPDSSGAGSPHWRPDFSMGLSPQAQELSDEGKKTVVLEGIIFRVLEIMDGMGGVSPCRVLLAGGLSREPFISRGLAACLNRKVELLKESEGTLLGAANLAAGLPFEKPADTIPTFPSRDGSYLREKYDRWRLWVKGLGIAQECKYSMEYEIQPL